LTIPETVGTIDEVKYWTGCKHQTSQQH